MHGAGYICNISSTKTQEIGPRYIRDRACAVQEHLFKIKMARQGSQGQGQIQGKWSNTGKQTHQGAGKN